MQNRIELSLFRGEESFFSRAELEQIVTPIGSHINPIKHFEVHDYLMNAITETTRYRVRSVINGVSHGLKRYYGLFEVTGTPEPNINWSIIIDNFYDRFRSIELHSGIIIPTATPCVTVSHRITAMRKDTKSNELRQSLVNETLQELIPHLNLEIERMNVYKTIKLTPELAHHYICKILSTGIIQGHVATTMIDGYDHPKDHYLQPRTLWSLFAHAHTILQRLKLPELITRSIELHDFFDELARFEKQPNQWAQQALLA
jgi:hypothetical protein